MGWLALVRSIATRLEEVFSARVAIHVHLITEKKSPAKESTLHTFFICIHLHNEVP